MGCTRGKEKAASYLKTFVEEMKASGFVEKAIEKHNVVGRLSVAALTSSKKIKLKDIKND